MNITFFLGNGFDRALGLKTGYSHFYEEYCKQQSNIAVIDEFRQIINDDVKKEAGQEEKLWSDAELGLAEITANYNITDFITCCEDMHDNLIEYLKKQDGKFVDAGESFGKILKIISTNFVEFQNDLTPVERNMFVKIRDNDKTNNTFINIITLNYTSICDKIFKALSSNVLLSWSSSYGTRGVKMGRMIHAHGYIDNFPILGVCDPDLIKNKDFLNDPSFRALMIKKESIDAVGETWREDTVSVINDSDIICIFGASLGKSDSDYWKCIAEWLKEREHRHLIIFKYDSNFNNSNISYYQQYVWKEVERSKFLGFSDYDEVLRSKLSARIHVVINAPNMFVVPDELKVKYAPSLESPSTPLTTRLKGIEK